jgi:saccharopine dehydrogenase-like NADP-dependent oxidoreductase
MKRNILLLGAGKSASALIRYFSEQSQKEEWQLTVADLSEELAQKKIAGVPGVVAAGLDIRNGQQLENEIAKVTLVISMLPANLHPVVAALCVKLGKHMATASYVSKEMQDLHEEAQRKGVVLLNECGLDPGIDHMSAMELIDKLRSDGAEITSFKSYTGGLVAPASDDNPWGYKFSWNPRNVILAGQGTARFVEDGKLRYIPYHRLFSEIESIAVQTDNSSMHLEGYANRDSLAYRKIYGLESIKTLLRGTLRKKNFCKAWNVFVQLGLTDDTYAIEESENITYGEWVASCLPSGLPGKTLLEKLAAFSHLDPKGEIMQMIAWTEILSDRKTKLASATPAQLLQQLLEEKWKLRDTDRDMIVMQHLLRYKLPHSKGEQEVRASLVSTGDDALHTAMAKTVGLPLALGATLILDNKLSKKGVRIPVDAEIYTPILEALKGYGILFSEERHEHSGVILN